MFIVLVMCVFVDLIFQALLLITGFKLTTEIKRPCENSGHEHRKKKPWYHSTARVLRISSICVIMFIAYFYSRLFNMSSLVDYLKTFLLLFAIPLHWGPLFYSLYMQKLYKKVIGHQNDVPPSLDSN